MPLINQIITSKEGSRPILVDFQNGKIQPDKNCDMKSKLFKSGDDKLVVGVTNGKMLYGGMVDSENDLYNNFVLINDRQTNTARLIQVDYTTLRPLVTKKQPLLDTSLSPKKTSVADLNRQFGSKKTKRRAEETERLKMNIDTVKEDLEKTVLGIKTAESDMQPDPSENDNLYRPRINRDASTRDQVYTLESLVPEAVLNTLSPEAESLLTADDIDEYGLTPFVKLNISRIINSAATKDSKISKINILLYISYLTKFMNTPMKNITKRFVVCDSSMEVNHHILDNYSVTTGSTRTRPLSMKDKFLCFTMVLTALAMDYEVNLELLAKDLKMGLKKVQDTSRVLAFSKTANKNVVVLKIPLPQEVAFSAKRRKH